MERLGDAVSPPAHVFEARHILGEKRSSSPPPPPSRAPPRHRGLRRGRRERVDAPPKGARQWPAPPPPASRRCQGTCGARRPQLGLERLAGGFCLESKLTYLKPVGFSARTSSSPSAAAVACASAAAVAAPPPPSSCGLRRRHGSGAGGDGTGPGSGAGGDGPTHSPRRGVRCGPGAGLQVPRGDPRLSRHRPRAWPERASPRLWWAVSVGRGDPTSQSRMRLWHGAAGGAQPRRRGELGGPGRGGGASVGPRPASPDSYGPPPCAAAAHARAPAARADACPAPS